MKFFGIIRLINYGGCIILKVILVRWFHVHRIIAYTVYGVDTTWYLGIWLSLQIHWCALVCSTWCFCTQLHEFVVWLAVYWDSYVLWPHIYIAGPLALSTDTCIAWCIQWWIVLRSLRHCVTTCTIPQDLYLEYQYVPYPGCLYGCSCMYHCKLVYNWELVSQSLHWTPIKRCNTVGIHITRYQS